MLHVTARSRYIRNVETITKEFFWLLSWPVDAPPSYFARGASHGSPLGVGREVGKRDAGRSDVPSCWRSKGGQQLVAGAVEKFFAGPETAARFSREVFAEVRAEVTSSY